jgi:hypothetical protein
MLSHAHLFFEEVEQGREGDEGLPLQDDLLRPLVVLVVVRVVLKNASPISSGDHFLLSEAQP